MDYSLILVGAVIVVSLLSATLWHLLVKSYAWAVVGSPLTMGLITYWAYPLYRGVAASALIVTNAVILAAVIALGVGIPFKRWRSGKAGLRS